MSSIREDYLPAKLPFQDLAWLSHLANWGKSPLVVLTRHWKQCILSALQTLRISLSTGPTELLLALEAMVYKGSFIISQFYFLGNATRPSLLLCLCVCCWGGG